jgi:hypothetical protein
MSFVRPDEPEFIRLDGGWSDYGNVGFWRVLTTNQASGFGAKPAFFRLWVSNLSHNRRSLPGRLFFCFGLRLFSRVGCFASFALPALEIIVWFACRVGCSENRPL